MLCISPVIRLLKLRPVVVEQSPGVPLVAEGDKLIFHSSVAHLPPNLLLSVGGMETKVM